MNPNDRYDSRGLLNGNGGVGSGSLGPQDHLEPEVIVQETYVVQPDLDVEAMDIGGIEWRPSRARWLLWGGAGISLGLLAFRLLRNNRGVIQDRARSLVGQARDRLQRFRGAEEIQTDSLIFQENPRPDMVSEDVADFSEFEGEIPTYQTAPSRSTASLDLSGFGVDQTFAEATSPDLGASSFSSNEFGASESPGSGGVSSPNPGLEDDKNLGHS